MSNNRRNTNRIQANLPIEIYVDSQITVQGTVKDISTQSAFIAMKSSIFMQVNDELKFSMKLSLNGNEERIGGVAKISRISPGEGIAIYFTRMEPAAMALLKRLVTGT